MRTQGGDDRRWRRCQANLSYERHGFQKRARWRWHSDTKNTYTSSGKQRDEGNLARQPLVVAAVAPPVDEDGHNDDGHASKHADANLNVAVCVRVALLWLGRATRVQRTCAANEAARREQTDEEGVGNTPAGRARPTWCHHSPPKQAAVPPPATTYSARAPARNSSR